MEAAAPASKQVDIVTMGKELCHDNFCTQKQYAPTRTLKWLYVFVTCIVTPNPPYSMQAKKNAPHWINEDYGVLNHAKQSGVVCRYSLQLFPLDKTASGLTATVAASSGLPTTRA